MISRKPSFRRSSAERRGAAAVELAVVSPLLVLLVVGTIDLGQFINVGQVAEQASRVGARKAAIYDTQNCTTVEASVHTYFKEYFPAMSDSAIAGAVAVTVCNSDGTALSGTELRNVETMSPVSVSVVVDFSQFRWLGGLPSLNGKNITVATDMRRQ